MFEFEEVMTWHAEVKGTRCGVEHPQHDGDALHRSGNPTSCDMSSERLGITSNLPSTVIGQC